MSSSSGSPSQNWNEILKRGSALSIIKSDVVFPSTGGGSTFGSTSGSTSGGSSSGGTTYPSGGQSSGGTTR
ncbi:hypothetical protein VTI74DRAFT_3547 [Chaetomium olivicolor]